MRKPIRVNLLLTFVAIWAVSAASLSAQTVIFNNSTNDLLARFNPGTTEVGNEILLAPGTPRFLTTFSFEFWGTNTASPNNTSFAGPVTAQIRFYENNGPLSSGVPSPGPTPFYDSGPISLASIGATPTDRDTLVFSQALDWPSGLLIPASDITWTVQFEGLGATDSVGLDLYYPATVGQTYGDYWAYNGSSWLLETNSEVPMSSFGAYMEATVPEPSTLLLSLLGGLGILTLACRLRRKD